MRSTLVALLLTGCRLHFDAVDAVDVADAAIGTEGNAEDSAVSSCPTSALVSDDFESDAYDPWLVWVDGGSMGVTTACGAAGSRCARAVATTANVNTRFGYVIDTPRSSVCVSAVAIPRAAIGGDSQLLAINFRDEVGTLSTQVGAGTQDGVIMLYEYNYVLSTGSSTPSTVPASQDVPLQLKLVVDHATKQAALELSGMPLVTIPLSPGLSVASASEVMIGLWVTAPTVNVDYDDVEID